MLLNLEKKTFFIKNNVIFRLLKQKNIVLVF